MKGLLRVLIETIEQVLLVEDSLVALNSSANLLLKDGGGFSGRLLLEVDAWERG